MRNKGNEMKKLDKMVSLEGAQGVTVLTSEELEELLVELTDMVQNLEKVYGERKSIRRTAKRKR